MAVYSRSSIRNTNNRESTEESTGLKHFNDPKAFIEYPNDMQDVYKNIEEYKTDKERKMLIFLMIWLLIWLITKN